jgi:hypothetical protein
MCYSAILPQEHGRHKANAQYADMLTCEDCLDIFREAQGAALSSRQIGEALAARQGLESTTVMIEQMRKNAIAVVHRLERTGTLIPRAVTDTAQPGQSHDTLTAPGFPPAGGCPASTHTNPG